MLTAFYRNDVTEAGCDEAGRGCLAGPVVAAAVVLPANYENPLLRDSKKLTPARRELLRAELEQTAVSWGIGVVCNEEIDRLNILKASFLAMHRALDQLAATPGHILVDGNRFTPYRGIPHTCVVRGDSLYMSIAAASVLAKTHRDDLMKSLHLQFPVYGWSNNKGYPTRMHTRAIKQHGLSPLHRRSFRIKPVQKSIDFSN